MRFFIKVKKRQITLLTLSVIFLIISFCPFSAYSEDNKPQGYQIIEINRTKVRLSIIPGEAKDGIIEVTNPSDQPKEVKLYLTDWAYVQSDGSKEFYPGGTKPFSAFQWINFSPVEFTVAPQGKEYVHYIVKVPPDAKGGHYATLFFESTIAKNVSMDLSSGKGISTPITLKVRVASMFYIEPEGASFRDIRMEKLSLNKKDNLLEINLDLKNTGNVDITTDGAFNIIDKEGNVYARGKFNQVFMFPGDPTVKLVSNWDKPLPKGIYDLIITIDIGKAQFDAGFEGGPIITKEAQVEVDQEGKVIKIGELK